MSDSVEGAPACGMLPLGRCPPSGIPGKTLSDRVGRCCSSSVRDVCWRSGVGMLCMGETLILGVCSAIALGTCPQLLQKRALLGSSAPQNAQFGIVVPPHREDSASWYATPGTVSTQASRLIWSISQGRKRRNNLWSMLSGSVNIHQGDPLRSPW